MSFIISFFFDEFRYIFNFEVVNYNVSIYFFCKGKFVVIDINCDDMSIEYFFSVLNSQVIKFISVVKNNLLVWFNFGFFNGFIGCYISICDRRGLGWIKFVRNFDSIVCSYDILFSYIIIY